MQKWEYCYVIHTDKNGGYNYQVFYMTPGGFVEGPIEKWQQGDGRDQNRARLVAKLGLDGWEMCSDGWTTFKRPLQEE